MVVGEVIYETDLVVIGGGPGGYTAAIHAADLGMDVVLIERDKKMGGVCLREGCIPSKTLINAVNIAQAAKNSENIGVICKEVDFDLIRLKKHMENTISQLSGGVSKLLDNREVDVINGYARFISGDQIYVDSANTIIKFKYAVIATGSRIKEFQPAKGLNIWDSAKALEVKEIPDTLLVIGGGYIGLEIGQAYAGLGSKVTLVEFADELLSGADRDLVKVVVKESKKLFEGIHTKSEIKEIEEVDGKFHVKFDTPEMSVTQTFDMIFHATGRIPNTDDIGLEKIGVETDQSGLIKTDEMCRTKIKDIFAVGDITEGPALAHKASRQAKVAVEVISGEPSAFDNVSVPCVLFTKPQLAWTGLTEDEAKKSNTSFKVSKFPLSALGKAKSVDKTDGMVKIISDQKTDLVLGVGIVCEHASELISECSLALEMGATLEDLIVTIHPHPTFSEAIFEASEMAKEGSVHMFKKKKTET